MRILQRKKTEATDEQKKLKEELNSLRVIRSVSRVGNFAMGTLLKGDMNSELVLFTQSVPTHSLLDKIMKLLPSCIDRSLNLGVTKADDESLVVSGELLNEKVACRISLTSRNIHQQQEPDNDQLPADGILLRLQQVRRVNFWKDICLSLFPAMEQLGLLFFALRSQENHVLAKLSEWQLLLIIYYSIGSFDSSMLGPIDAIRRICEVICSGVLFYGGGQRDPVEPTDFIVSVPGQALEDVVMWAGTTLRRLAFDQLSDVFDLVDDDESDESASQASSHSPDIAEPESPEHCPE